MLKLSPSPDLDQLSCERNLLRMEAVAIELAARAGVPVAGLLRAGHREVTPLELTPAARVRIDLYRAYLCLILLIENGPRQYPPGRARQGPHTRDRVTDGRAGPPRTRGRAPRHVGRRSRRP